MKGEPDPDRELADIAYCRSVAERAKRTLGASSFIRELARLILGLTNEVIRLRRKLRGGDAA